MEFNRSPGHTRNHVRTCECFTTSTRLNLCFSISCLYYYWSEFNPFNGIQISREYWYHVGLNMWVFHNKYEVKSHQWSNDGMVTIHRYGLILSTRLNLYSVKSDFDLFISFIWLIANCTLHKPLIVEQLFSSDYPFASNCALIFFPGHKQKFAQWDGWFLLNIFSSIHIYHHLTSILLPFHKLTNKQTLRLVLLFSCPEQLNRWPCHSLSHSLTHSGLY